MLDSMTIRLGETPRQMIQTIPTYTPKNKTLLSAQQYKHTLRSGRFVQVQTGLTGQLTLFQ